MIPFMVCVLLWELRDVVSQRIPFVLVSHAYSYGINWILGTDLHTSETQGLVIFQSKSKKLKKYFSAHGLLCI